jgi:transcriptional regulator GlxA family with amidase domain
VVLARPAFAPGSHRGADAPHLERARHLLESSELTADQSAGNVGVATGASLRQHFATELGGSPVAYRRTSQAAHPSQIGK